MKVKQLKEILEKYADDVNVLMADFYPVSRVVETTYGDNLCLVVTDFDDDDEILDND